MSGNVRWKRERRRTSGRLCCISMTCSYTLTLWENSIFLNKNSTRVQAKHSLQAHFHLLKSSILTQTHTSDTHCLFQLSTGAQSGTVSPGARPEPSTRIKPLTPWSCFQTDHVTHQKRHKRGNGMTEESQREIMNGEKMKKKRKSKCTHSRPSLGLDWKRSSGRNWSLFLFRRLQGEIEEGKWRKTCRWEEKKGKNIV